MVCSSCDKQRAELHPRNSRLNKKMKLYLCNECDQQQREPRWLIILVGRKEGLPAIKKYIIKHQYVGDTITAKELA